MSQRQLIDVDLLAALFQRVSDGLFPSHGAAFLPRTVEGFVVAEGFASRGNCLGMVDELAGDISPAHFLSLSLCRAPEPCGSNQLAEEQVGWDWFGLHLDNGMDLMLYRIRREDGTVEPVSSGTLIEPDGRTTHLPFEAFVYSIRDTWTSRKSKTVYPSRWVIAVPDHGIELTITPTVADQELVTTKSTRVTYWEGSVLVTGRVGGDKVTGRGYAELTGYAGSMKRMF